MPPLTKEHVLSIFAHLAAGEASSFFDHVAEDVDWLVTGSAHPLAKRYHSKEQFIRESWRGVGSILQKPMKLSVVGVMVEPEEGGMKGRAVVELKGVGGVLKSGECYPAPEWL